jgi:signal transduction histidine kinase
MKVSPKRWRRVLTLAMTACAVLYFGAAPARTVPPPDTSGSRVLRIAGDNAFPPYEYLSLQGVYKGFNVDILRAVALQNGWDLELIPLPWSEVRAALDRGEVDAIQGMKYSPERDKLYDFSDPYLNSSLSIFVRRERVDIHELEDLSGRRVAAQQGDIAVDLLRRVPEVDLRLSINQGESLKLLLAGEVDAAVGNHLTGLYLLQQLGQAGAVKVVGEPLAPANYALAVREGINRALLREFNQGLAAIRKNGTYDRIYQKWFGAEIPDYPQRLRQLFYGASAAVALLFVAVAVVIRVNRRLRDEVARQAEKLARKERLESVGELAAALAHEIRNPLTAIKTLVELLPQKLDNPAYRAKLVEIVPQEVRRLDLLITSLLDYARPRLPVRQAFSAAQSVSEVLAVLEEEARAKGLTLQNKVPADLILWADPGQVRQILTNVVLNAIQILSPGGKIVLDGGVRGGCSVLFCHDNGPGIKAEDLSRVFDPFFSRRQGGTGLGLFLSYRLAQENGGDLGIESIEGQGTTVRLTLPLGGEPGVGGVDRR